MHTNSVSGTAVYGASLTDNGTVGGDGAGLQARGVAPIGAAICMVRGDPLVDIAVLRRVETTIKGGVLYDPRALYATAMAWHAAVEICRRFPM